MGIFLALLCSVTYGAGDFFGGSAARRVHPFAVGWASHTMVLGPIALAAVFVGDTSIAAGDVVWGVVGGLLGAGALLALYAGLARGPMTIVAPTTALVAASLPVVIGSVLQGERPSPYQWAGIGLALVAIVVISLSPTSETASGNPGNHTVTKRFNTTTFGLAVLAGAGFGMFFVAVHETSKNAGLWPLVFGRAASAGLFSLLVLSVKPFRKRVLTKDLQPNLAIIGVSAALDVIANVFYLVANRLGDLSIIAVLSSLYPASTIVLANRLFKEQIAQRQALGMGLAAVAVGLIAAG